MELEQIAELTIEDVYRILLDRILDLSVVPEGEEWVTLHEDAELPFYDRIIVHPTLVKPPLELIDAEFVEYVAELTAVEEARLAEIARVEDFTARFEALKPDHHAVANRIGRFESNAKVQALKAIEGNDLQLLELMEAEAIIYRAEVAVVKNAETRRLKGVAARKLVDTLLDTIAGHNIDNALTDIQLDEMEVEFAPIMQALQAKRPMKAKDLIEAVTPDGVKVTAELKAELLGIYIAAGV